MDKTIRLGCEARDKVTGFKGIVITQCLYLNKCVQFCVKARVDEKGEIKDGHWFDFEQLEWVGRGILPEEEVSRTGRDTGGGSRQAPSETYKG